MRSKATCLLIGIYTTDRGKALTAYNALRSKGFKSLTLLGASAETDKGKADPRLPRLDGEALVTTLTDRSRLKEGVDLMRAEGVPTVFVLPPDFKCSIAGPQADQRVHAKLRSCEASLKCSLDQLRHSVILDHPLSPAAEWLLDNAHLARTQIIELHRHLPKQPRAARYRAQGSDGYEYAFELARQIASAGDHVIQVDDIIDSLHASQASRQLSIAELWALPLLLRLALLEALSAFASRVSHNQQVRETAYFWANRLISSARRDPATLEQVLSQMAAEPIAGEPFFITCQVEQLQDEDTALARFQHWIETGPGSSLDELVRIEHNREAAECVSISNAFGSLRTLARIDFSDVFEATSLVERELRLDPSDFYAKSDFTTRDQCRKAIEYTARYSSIDELTVAKRANALALKGDAARSRLVAYYLIDEGILELEHDTGARIPMGSRFLRTVNRHSTGAYIASIVLITLSFLVLVLGAAWETGVRPPGMLVLLGVLALFPLSELAIQIVHALVISMFPPCKLPKLNLEDGIPLEYATLVVVPMMLSNSEAVQHEIRKLEIRFLANPEANLYFGLLSDFEDALTPTTARDTALFQTVRDSIQELNQRRPGGRFLLFHRRRTWSESEQLWIGRERKRGKLEDLNAYLNGESSQQLLAAGALLVSIRYVITLDSDTQLPPGAARRMIETIAHPLNRVEIDPVRHARIRGYTIIQPRVSVALPDAAATRFTRIFADATGTDPYCQTVSDAQQDLFGHAIFHGKAIYEVGSFSSILHQRFPPETILSHDLIEGAHVGVGLATDIELFENIPLDYAGYCKRQHRWIRGDWQIAQWILANVPGESGTLGPNPLTIINRWRIFDNLRRSVVPIASVLLLLLGWLISASPGVWTLMLLLALAIPVLASLLDRLARRIQGTIQGWQGAADELVRTIVLLAFLPHQGWLAMDAIVRVTFRRWISRRNLLEWQTAEGVHTDSKVHIGSTMKALLVISGLSSILMLALGARDALFPATGFVALWIASPGLMKWLGSPGLASGHSQLRRTDSIYLRRIARQTWRYFDDLVTQETNWLPPDNSQLALRIEVAQRTSPTNIGLWLNSALAAYDFGYLTTDELWRRCNLTLTTLQGMEHYEGHLLNWYDIQTLTPLPPRYVSTVDSGNLLAALWVLNQGCLEALSTPIISSLSLRGLFDELAILRRVCGRDPSTAVPIQALRRLLRGKVEGHALIGRLRLAQGPAKQLLEVRSPGDERSYWASKFAQQLQFWITSIDRYLLWMEVLTQPPDSLMRELGDEVVRMRRRAVLMAPSLLELAGPGCPQVDSILFKRGDPGMSPDLATWLDRLAVTYEQCRAHASESVHNLKELGANANRIADGMNMKFLFDQSRELFGVGYAVGDPLVFTSHYDLLASECRLASLVSIAKGDVPLTHWKALGRPRVTTAKRAALLSWSGTMFEYLMPPLYTPSFPNSLLNQACKDALDRQIDYGRDNNIPWGNSECGYSALDANQIYQYRAFGVPQLALQRDLKGSLVVAPYATMLALPLDPPAAIDNLKRLEGLGVSGTMGFYESIDFTREAKRGGELGLVIYSYMAHHQGMSLLALNNLLHQDPIKRRFRNDLRIRAFESLLFERIPISRPISEETQAEEPAIKVAPVEQQAHRNWDQKTIIPQTNLLGNGKYALMITNSGTGYSRWNGFDINRWRADSTLDPWGAFLYIRDLKSGAAWAAAPHPLGSNLGSASVRFTADHAEFHRLFMGIETLMHITVAAEDNAELRRVSVTNRSLRARKIEFTSYLELALAPHAMDKAHPAFAKMFIETECVEPGVLFARRRPRSAADQPIWAAHILIGAGGEIQHETDRGKFLGRGNGADSPVALQGDLSGSAGAVLDPIFSLRCRITLEPRERVELSFITLAASSREELLALAAKYRRPESVSRQFEMAWTRSQLEFRHLGIGAGAAHRFQELAGHLIYPNAAFRASDDRLLRNMLGQSSLWIYGLSGDLPILSITATDARSLPLIREVLVAHSYWRARGFQADLVILNQESPSYDHPLRLLLQRQIAAHSSQPGVERSGSVYLLDWHAIPEEHRTLILAVSNVILSGSRGSLQQQLLRTATRPSLPLLAPPNLPVKRLPEPLPFLELPYFNGIGGFTRDAREYAIYLKPETNTPAPWINVMANRNFGTAVSESGLGVTWHGNSQAHRLTPWHNDPLSDPQSEIIYIRDESTGEYWTPTALPIRGSNAHRARHGQGYTVFEHSSNGISQELTVFVPISGDGDGDAIKIYRLHLRNNSSSARQLSATYYAAWVLGADRDDLQSHIHTAWDQQSNALLATHNWNDSGGKAFVSCSSGVSSYTADRAQFFGLNGSCAKPAALAAARLDNRTGGGLDPAAVLQCQLQLAPGARADVIFMLGEAASTEEVRLLLARYRTVEQVESALTEVHRYWDNTLGALQVRTPSLSTNFLLNRWLLYQTMSCRYFGRSALYQSGGAFGFRDQLQDSLAFLYSKPQLTRAHILASAARQFVEGDVQHWWHPESGNGVRTRCSDDLLWLPYAVCRYVEITGDDSILKEEVPFIEGALLAEGEQDRLFVPTVSAQGAPLWDHCRRAIEKAWRLGPHGLPLIGSGDWNDGMNHVGAEGRGESAWLGWFLPFVTRDFARLIEDLPPGAPLAIDWLSRADGLLKTMERECWDGQWYVRGFFDNGSVLGSKSNSEATIDSLPQSWAAISGAADPARMQMAMQSAEDRLVDRENKLIKLFTPPFNHSEPNPGYIMGYPPGVRENGGQYTHGSLWLAMARARMGDGAAAVRLLEMMNPIEKNRNPAEVECYRGEPYVVAADVYASPNFAGRCGWTWYTGSASWMYRIWIEEVLGFHLRGNRLTMNPVIPQEWPKFEMWFHYRTSQYEINVHNNSEVRSMELDGKPVSGDSIELVDDGGSHLLIFRIPVATYSEQQLLHQGAEITATGLI